MRLPKGIIETPIYRVQCIYCGKMSEESRAYSELIEKVAAQGWSHSPGMTAFTCPECVKLKPWENKGKS